MRYRTPFLVCDKANSFLFIHSVNHSEKRESRWYRILGPRIVLIDGTAHGLKSSLIKTYKMTRIEDGPGVCIALCEARCACLNGYLRDANKNCIPEIECKAQLGLHDAQTERWKFWSSNNVIISFKTKVLQGLYRQFFKGVVVELIAPHFWWISSKSTLTLLYFLTVTR